MDNIHLWTQCHGQKHILTLQETAWRIVEAQHILSTRKLVDSAAEQEILEELIESVKPKFFGKDFIGLHPLLYTPFRYPPLKYGSRFGNHSERSLWYGSLQLSGALTEKAFYQFVFLKGSKANFGLVETVLTAFSAPIKTTQGVNLTQPPFNRHQKKISDPNSYQISQLLGTAMRQAKVEAFCYKSARDAESIHIALFAPKAFLHKTPHAGSFQTWKCISSHESVEFTRTSALKNESKYFSITCFQVNGKVPYPA